MQNTDTQPDFLYFPGFDLGAGDRSFDGMLSSLGLDPTNSIAAVNSIPDTLDDCRHTALFLASPSKAFQLTGDGQLTELDARLFRQGSLVEALRGRDGGRGHRSHGWRVRTTNLNSGTWGDWTPLESTPLAGDQRKTGTADLGQFWELVSDSCVDYARARVRAGLPGVGVGHVVGILDDPPTSQTVITLSALREPTSYESNIEAILSGWPLCTEADASTAVWACLKAIQNSGVHSRALLQDAEPSGGVSISIGE